MPPARPASLKVRALRWLAQREHSRQELGDKLMRLLQRAQREADASRVTCGDGHGHGDGDGDLGAADVTTDRTSASVGRAQAQAEVDTVLQWLEAHGHLSDARFAESRVHARQARYGNQRIRQELRQHGVALDAPAQEALAASEFDRACTLWHRKYGEPATDAAGRVRQMRFLAGRGFSMDVVQRVLKHGGRLGAGGSAGDESG